MEGRGLEKTLERPSVANPLEVGLEQVLLNFTKTKIDPKSSSFLPCLAGSMERKKRDKDSFIFHVNFKIQSWVLAKPFEKYSIEVDF